MAWFSNVTTSHALLAPAAAPPPSPAAGPAHISMPAVLAAAALVGADAVVSWSLGLGVHWWLLVGVVR